MSDNHFAVLEAEETTEPYRVEIPGKGKFVVPHVNSLDVFELNNALEAAGSDLDLIVEVLTLAMPEGEMKRLREAKLNRPTLIALYTAWQKHCGMGEGE